MMIDGLKAVADIAIDHNFARVNVGPEFVARNAVKLFSGENLPIFGGEPLADVHDAGHRGLRNSEVTTHLADRTGAFDAEHESFVSGELFIHNRMAIQYRINRQSVFYSDALSSFG